MHFVIGASFIFSQLATGASASTGTQPQTVEWEGYAVLNYSRYDFFKNVQDNTADERARIDLERVVLESKYKINDKMKFEVELEIEHGGTGSAVEYEAEEFGEYELELEKGGEVVIEKAQLEIHSSPLFNWHIGHIVVPFGMANRYTKPVDYFTSTRSLAETALIPNTWHESGVELYGRLLGFNYRALVVNGLDSSGFNSQNWIASGYQTRMDFANADDLALVGVVDLLLGNKGLLGAAGYFGNTANNRHQQNLNADAHLLIGEIHLRYQYQLFTLRAQYMHGFLENSQSVSEANKNLVNQDIRGVSATPVGRSAKAWFIETGIDVFELFSRNDEKLIWFARYDSWDSMDSVQGNIVDNPRYERSVVTTGINYFPLDNIVVKAEFAQHRHAGSIADRYQQMALGLGVTF